MILWKIARMDQSTACVQLGRCSDAEDGVEEQALRHRIALSDPADLTFADCLHRLIALDSIVR
jgi:hypothetical protein